MTDLTIRVPDDWDDETMARWISQSVEAAVVDNFLWYLAEWDAGRDPACCPKCAGVRYSPAAIGTQWYVELAPVIIAKLVASCESAAAMHTAHKRADGFRNLTTARPLLKARQTPEGQAAWDAVKKAYQIQLEQVGPSYWHVVSIDEGERHDATEEMSR